VLEDVLDEVMDLFPGTYIHVGGDEAVKDQWKADPATQAKIKALGLADEHALQSWFIQRLGTHIAAHGRRLIGWDEILEGGLAPDATVMSWRGIDGAVAAAKLGHDTVLSPWPLLYLDNRQSASADEPPGRSRVVSLKDVYDFDPAPAALTPEERAHVLGVQANGWTEHMRTDARLQQMTFPRLTALAEVGWSPERVRDWKDFAGRLPASLARLDVLGVAYDSVPFEPQAQLAAGTATTAQVTLASGLGLGEIRYTTDGRTPSLASPLYAGPVTVTTPTTVRSRTYLAGRPLGRVRDADVDAAALSTRNSHQLKACTDKLTLSLEDDAPAKGPRAVFLVDLMDPCWIWSAADLTEGAALTAWVGQVPFNFQIGADRDKIPLRAPATAAGELEVRLDTCEGPVAAVLPLAPAVGNPAVSKLAGQIAPRAGVHDLCFMFTARSVDPTWVIDKVALTAAASEK
jgi:hexosaminidase